MGRTLLVGHQTFTWHDWLKGSSRDIVNLDPRNADHGPSCRAFWISGGKVRSWTLIGSVDAARNPVGLLTAAWRLAEKAAPDAIVSLFEVRSTPVLRQLALDLAQALAPTEVLVPQGSGLAGLGWPVGAHEVELPEAFPHMVIEAQRRARWLEMFENSEDHEVSLKEVTTIGARLGSGTRIQLAEWPGWSEVSGGVLHLVGDHEPTDHDIGLMLDHSHAARLSMTSPNDYAGLLCSFAGEDGEDFGIGTVHEFMPERGLLKIRSTAVPPAPVRILRFGTMKLDKSGRESHDLKPWSL